MLLLGLAACSPLQEVDRADNAWASLVEERGDSYTWSVRAELFDESTTRTEVRVEDGLAVWRRETFTPGHLGGEPSESVEEGTLRAGGPTTIPAWQDACRRSIDGAAPRSEVFLELDEDGLITRCDVVQPDVVNDLAVERGEIRFE